MSDFSLFVKVSDSESTSSESVYSYYIQLTNLSNKLAKYYSFSHSDCYNYSKISKIS